ncbi:MAG TPA: WD40 repeat domain-containing protein, partial [Fimbriimonadales bacterium]|nr:WD40 repeat domain-containing protein [Fimbriimonadales bacterium]
MGKTICSAVAALTLMAQNAMGQEPEILWMSGSHSGGVSSVRFSPDSALLYSGGMSDQTVKVWRVSDGRLLRTINAFYAGVRMVAPSPVNGRYLASVADASFGSGEPTLKQWSPADTSPRPAFYAAGSVDLPLFSLAYSRDGSRIAVGNNRYEIDVYDAATGSLLHRLFGHNWFSFGLAYSPDGKYLASASGDQTIKLWDATTGELVRTLTGHTFFVDGVAWSPDSRILASASWDGTVRFWNPETGASLRTVDLGDESAMYAIAYAPDGATVVTGGTSEDGTGSVYLIRVADGAILQTLSPAHPGALFDLTYSPDDSLIASSGAGSAIHTWHAGTGTYNRQISANRAAVPDVDVSPNGLLVADCGGLTPGGDIGGVVEIMQSSDG